MKFVIRRDQYGRGKRPGFITADPKCVPIREWEGKQEKKFLQVVDRQLKRDI